MKGHKEAISGVVWSDTAEIVTSSWDHTLKIWDSELGGMKHEIPGNKSFFDVDYSRLSRAVLTASADRHVRLYDPRSTGKPDSSLWWMKMYGLFYFTILIRSSIVAEGSVVKAMFTSHTQWVQTVRWSTTDEHLFISGAYDNNLKLWDTRRWDDLTASICNLSSSRPQILIIIAETINLSQSKSTSVRSFRPRGQGSQ